MENICRVLCVCFFFFFPPSDISPAFFPGHLSLFYRYSTLISRIFSSSEKRSFLEIVLEKNECSVFGCVSLWDRKFVVTSPFSLPVNILTSHILCVIYAPVLCASEHSRSLGYCSFSGFNTQHKKSFGLG